jgi:phospholipid transport system transporter-binding protein
LSRLTKNADGEFTLSGNFNRESLAGAMHFDAFDSEIANTTVRIDMSAVEHCDTAGLAWMINMLKYLSQRDISWTLAHIPETLTKLAKISDLEHLISVA